MRRLIICNSLYQIIIAIQMKITIFQDDSVDFWISDHSVGAREIAKKMTLYEQFRGTKFIETKAIVYSIGKLKKVKNVFQYGLGFKTISNIPNYDEIIFYGFSIIEYGIEAIYKRRKHSVVWSRYEEGILSYDTDKEYGKSVAMLKKINNILKNNDIENQIKNYYCFFPELKMKNRQWNLVAIPLIQKNDQNLKEMLLDIFEFHGYECKQKYIYFASSSDIDGRSYGETELIREIADVVGKDNLLVKVHPRDTRNVFVEAGIEVMQVQGVPWEVIQLCGDMNGKVLLTTESGSFMSITAILKETTKGYYIFPCVKSGRESFAERDAKIRDVINRMHQKGECENIDILFDLGELEGIACK